MPGSVIVAGARTPIGKMSGAFKGVPAADLGATAIKAALAKAGVGPDKVEYVIMGQVLQAGQGQNPSRFAAVRAGVPMSVPTITINKVCLSGLNAISLADALIAQGEYDIVVAGGMESMTEAPYLLPGARGGFRYGKSQVLDATEHDGLTDGFDHIAMGASTEKFTKSSGITREEQDEVAAESHARAADAIKNGRFDEEIAPVSVPQRKGDPVEVSEDEGVRANVTAESLGKLPAAFDRKEGTITAGSSSQISDGAAAVVVMSKAKAEELGVTPIAEVGAHGWVAGPDNSLLSQPANAINKALAKEGKSASDVDLFEINEAFASVAIQSTRQLGVSRDIVNVDGGAISLGHPIGASGARIAIHVIYELARRGGGLAAAGLCGGGGQGDALLFRVPGR